MSDGSNPVLVHRPTAKVWLKLRYWFQVSRAYAFPASLVPLALGAATAWSSAGDRLQWYLFPFIVVAGLLLHTATNLLNDRDDFMIGVDRPGTRGGSGFLVEGSLAPERVERAGLLCLLLASLIGVVLILLRGWPLLIIGLLGALGAWGYTARGHGYKYYALGDPLVGLLMGPLMVLGAHLALGAPFSLAPLWTSLPIALLVMAILAGNNLRDIADDAAAGIKTMAILLGTRGALVWYLVLLFGAYIVLGVLCGLRLLPWPVLGTVLTFPLAIRLARHAWRGARDGAPTSVDVPVATAQLHLLFGGLLLLGFIVGHRGG